MRQFLKLNKNKAIFALKFMCLLFCFLITIVLVYPIITKKIDDYYILIHSYIFFGLIMPIFILVLAFFEWKIKTSKLDKILMKEPFSRLGQIGFKGDYINEKTKWYFTFKTISGYINGFKIICDSFDKTYKNIGFLAFAEAKFFDKKKFKYLKEKYGKESIVFFNRGLIKTIDIRNQVSSIEQLEKELINFTNVLKSENILPSNEENPSYTKGRI